MSNLRWSEIYLIIHKALKKLREENNLKVEANDKVSETNYATSSRSAALQCTNLQEKLGFTMSITVGVAAWVALNVLNYHIRDEILQ